MARPPPIGEVVPLREPGPPRVNSEMREKFRSLCEPRWANALLALDRLVTLSENRTRYPGGVLDDDVQDICLSLHTKVDEIEEAFRRGSRKPLCGCRIRRSGSRSDGWQGRSVWW